MPITSIPEFHGVSSSVLPSFYRILIDYPRAYSDYNRASIPIIHQFIGSPPQKIWKNLTGNLFSDLAQVNQWRKDWLVKFSAAKNKLVTSHHHQADPKLSAIRINWYSLRESHCVECLLGINFTPELVELIYTVCC